MPGCVWALFVMRQYLVCSKLEIFLRFLRPHIFVDFLYVRRTAVMRSEQIAFQHGTHRVLECDVMEQLSTNRRNWENVTRLQLDRHASGINSKRPWGAKNASALAFGITMGTAVSSLYTIFNLEYTYFPMRTEKRTRFLCVCLCVVFSNE